MFSRTLKRLPIVVLLTLCLLENADTSSNETSSETDTDWSVDVTWPVGDPRWCLERLWGRENPGDRTQMFQVLPGLGWDNLRNMETAPVLDYSYTNCRLTDDGEFLIPDNVFLIPLKTSHLQTFAELIDEWKELKSMTARTINLNPGFSMAGFSISGAFSREYAQVKGKQIEDASATIRVQLRYHRYKAKLRPGASLSPEFKTSLLEIAKHLELNQTDRARYESEVLVRNFGTHVLTSVTAGAALVKEDYVKRSYLEDYKENKSGLLTSASGAFKQAFALTMGISEKKKDEQKSVEGYMNNLTHSYTQTLGGDVFLAGGMTAHDWAKDLDTNLVAMDRAGDPLYLLITQRALPELPQAMVERLERIVRDSVLLYYKMNVIPGCTDRSFSKFSVTANFDDGSCKTEAQTGLALGGIYQECEARGETLDKDPCHGIQKPNALTGELSCPDGFRAVVLHESDGPGKVQYKRKCDWCNLLGLCCHTDQVVGYAHFKTFWCAGRLDGHAHEAADDDSSDPVKLSTGPGKPEVQDHSTSDESHSPDTLINVLKSAAAKDQGPASAQTSGVKLGYTFGGVYTDTTENLVTNTRACPEGFYPRQIFFHLKVCISDDFETTSALAVPFGGFFSCSIGNPLAAADSELMRKGIDKPLEKFLAKVQSSPGNWPKKCPVGYSQHLAIEVAGCAIHYCAESGALKATNLPKVKVPPFSPEPPESEEGPELVFDPNSMTWIPNPILSEDDRSPDPGSNIVQAPDAAPDNLDPGSATSDHSNANAKGTQRAEGQGSSSRDGYIQMRSEVFVGLLVICVSLVGLTWIVAVYLVRRRTKQLTPNSEVTPLRLQGKNPAYEETEGVAIIDESRQTVGYNKVNENNNTL